MTTNEEDQRFTVEEFAPNWFRVWDLDRGVVATTGHLTRELAQASADRMNERARRAAR